MHTTLEGLSQDRRPEDCLTPDGLLRGARLALRKVKLELKLGDLPCNQSRVPCFLGTNRFGTIQASSETAIIHASGCATNYPAFPPPASGIPCGSFRQQKNREHCTSAAEEGRAAEEDGTPLKEQRGDDGSPRVDPRWEQTHQESTSHA